MKGIKAALAEAKQDYLEKVKSLKEKQKVFRLVPRSLKKFVSFIHLGGWLNTERITLTPDGEYKSKFPVFRFLKILEQIQNDEALTLQRWQAYSSGVTYIIPDGFPVPDHAGPNRFSANALFVLRASPSGEVEAEVCVSLGAEDSNAPGVAKDLIFKFKLAQLHLSMFRKVAFIDDHPSYGPSVPWEGCNTILWAGGDVSLLVWDLAKFKEEFAKRGYWSELHYK